MCIVKLKISGYKEYLDPNNKLNVRTSITVFSYSMEYFKMVRFSLSAPRENICLNII